MKYIIDNKIQYKSISLVERKDCTDYRCLIDQSPENLWAWYNETVKDSKETNDGFKISFLENLVKKFIEKSDAIKDKQNV